jgi:aminoglycoside/choline kinase family phosphotransferase
MTRSDTPPSLAPTDAAHPSRTVPDERLAALARWLGELAGRHSLDAASIRPASNDASFRRYFRIDTDTGTLIAMDAPPAHEDCRPFVHAARVLAEAGLRVPAVLEADLENGFLLLEDLGAKTCLDRLAELAEEGAPAAAVDRLYRSATDSLTLLQQASRPGVFPDYDRALLARELALYPDWYLARHRGFTPGDAERNTLRAAFDALLANNLAQPRVFVHRDYHSRNLMYAEHFEAPGVLDFQDAVYGPITYDLVSLLRDAYVEWPEERQLDWAIRWWESARKAGLPVCSDFSEFWRDLEWMGLQRHLKVLGIFARLCHRDGKARYLDDIPRVLASVIRVAGRYNAFSGLARLIDKVEGGVLRTGHTF